MDAVSTHLLTPLRRRELAARCGSRGGGLAVFAGTVWLTQARDGRDVVLEAGDSFDFDRPGWVVVEALTPAAVLWFERADPVPNRAAAAPGPAADGSHISAFALQRAARDMRHAALARALVRAAGALTYAWASLRSWLAPRLARLTAPRAGASGCRDLQAA